MHNITITNPNGIKAQKDNALEVGPPVEVLSVNPSTVGRGVKEKTIIQASVTHDSPDGIDAAHQ